MILAIVGTRSFSSPRGLEYASLLVEHEVKSLRWDSFVTGDPEYSNDKGVDALCVQWCGGSNPPFQTPPPPLRKGKPPRVQAVAASRIQGEEYPHRGNL